MEIQQVAKLLVMAQTAYPNKSAFRDEELALQLYHQGLCDMDPNTVLKNFNEHVKSSSFFPTVNDLRKDEKKVKIEGRYVPDVRTTMLEMQQKEQERYLALTTNVTNVSLEQIQAAKEKALKTIANAVKRSEEENPYKVVD